MSDLLPPAPRRLVSGYMGKRLAGGGLAIAAAIAVASAYGIWQWGTAQEILHDSRIWAEGEVSVPAEVEGQETSRDFILNSYELKVHYADESGREHRGEMKFDLLFASVDRSQPTAVRYRRADPSDFALNWAAEATTARWASFAFMAFAGVGLIGGSLFFLGLTAIRNARLAERAARAGVEVECRITSIEQQIVQGRPTDALIFRFQLPDHILPSMEGSAEQEVIMPAKKGGPILLAGATKLVALVDPAAPKAFLVPRDDLFPLEVDEATKREILSRAAQLS